MIISLIILLNLVLNLIDTVYKCKADNATKYCGRADAEIDEVFRCF